MGKRNDEKIDKMMALRDGVLARIKEEDTPMQLAVLCACLGTVTVKQCTLEPPVVPAPVISLMTVSKLVELITERYRHSVGIATIEAERGGATLAIRHRKGPPAVGATAESASGAGDDGEDDENRGNMHPAERAAHEMADLFKAANPGVEVTVAPLSSILNDDEEG